MRPGLIKIAVDIVVFITLIVIISSIAGSISPLITNDNALGQMQNSNDMYVLMNTYNRIQTVFVLIYGVTVLSFGYNLFRDYVRYFKKDKGENE